MTAPASRRVERDLSPVSRGGSSAVVQASSGDELGPVGWTAHSWRLACPAIVAWLTALVLLGLSATVGAIVAALSASALMAAWIVTRARGKPSNTALAVLACMAATAAVVAFKVHTVTTGPVVELARDRTTVTAEAVISDDPRIRLHRGGVSRRSSAVVEARMASVEVGGVGDSARSVRFLVDVPVVLLGSGDGWRSLLPSQRIRVHGRLGAAEPGELTAAVLLVRGPPEVLTGPSAMQSVAGALRAGLREACDVLAPAERGLLPGLVVGDVSRMDDQVRQDFKTAGLSHLTAVSGANLALIAGAMLMIARFAGLPLAARAIVAIVAMVAFAVVARPSPSVLRALVMGTVAAIALGTGRSRDGVTALSATVLGLILFDPGLARQYGFALSVVATAGILVLAPRWRDRMARRMPRLVAEAIAVPAAAQAAVTPVLVLMSGQLGLAAVPANLLAGPAVAPATLLGFTAALVAPFSMGWAQVLVHPAGLAVGWIIMVAERAAELPAASVGWPGGIPGLALLMVVAAVGWAVLRRRAGRYVAAALAIGGVLAVLVAGPVISPWPPAGWLLVACDVGQGDAMVASTGHGRAVVIDTGPEPALMDRCLRDLGVSQVALMVLTHPHLDHVGGVTGVLRGRAVGASVVSPVRIPEGESGRVSGELRSRRIPEWVMPPTTHWRFGPVELTVLAPEPGQAREGPGEGAIANNGSVVLLLRWFDSENRPVGSALLAGDLETEAQAALLRRGVPAVDLLKVPHHGSSRQDPRFLAATRARAALISVGADNDYGHPAPLTMSRLGLLGMRIYRTDTSGDLAVVARDGHLAVVPRGKR